MSASKIEVKKVRVAAVQFAAGSDVEANLATCLRMLDLAAKERPDLVVLPEFANHLSWYDDKAHCHRVSVTLAGPFLTAIAAKAKEHGMHVVVNCTVQRDDATATGTSLLYGPTGVLLGASDKQVLMGHENDFLARAVSHGPVIETAIGRIGLYACMDGVIAETPRGLALRGAQILCNSLNSFAPDEAELHVPVRAAENRVFVVAANKVGPLIPEALLAPVSAATQIPLEFLSGAGESQIVAPDGAVLAKAPKLGEAVVVADIDVAQADDKRRLNGTDVFKSRRPELYIDLAAPRPTATFGARVADDVAVAVYAPRVSGADAIVDATAAIVTAAASEVKLIVLPELFCFDGATVAVSLDTARARSREAVSAIASALASYTGPGLQPVVATSLLADIDGHPRHVGVLIGKGGVLLTQPQLHATARHSAWTAPRAADGIRSLDLPIGRIALVVGDDAAYPETMRLVAMRGVEIVALPFHAQERWETALGIPERAAENRVCIVAATRPTDAGTSVIATLWRDFTLMTPWATRPFDGRITAPRLVRASRETGLVGSTIHPSHARNKVVSHRTHLIDDRPWPLASALVNAPRERTAAGPL